MGRTAASRADPVRAAAREPLVFFLEDFHFQPAIAHGLREHPVIALRLICVGGEVRDGLVELVTLPRRRAGGSILGRPP